jgi:hypothetical protein
MRLFPARLAATRAIQAVVSDSESPCQAVSIAPRSSTTYPPRIKPLASFGAWPSRDASPPALRPEAAYMTLTHSSVTISCLYQSDIFGPWRLFPIPAGCTLGWSAHRSLHDISSEGASDYAGGYAQTRRHDGAQFATTATVYMTNRQVLTRNHKTQRCGAASLREQRRAQLTGAFAHEGTRRESLCARRLVPASYVGDARLYGGRVGRSRTICA